MARKRNCGGRKAEFEQFFIAMNRRYLQNLWVFRQSFHKIIFKRSLTC